MKPYYEHAGIQIYHGNAAEILPDLKADLCLTDPPYGIGFKYGSYHDTEENFRASILPIINDCIGRFPKTIVMMSMRQMWELPKARWVLCWAKPGSRSRNSVGGFSEWEPIFVYGKCKFSNDYKYLPDCINHSRDSGGHPCPKPLRLFNWLIKGGAAHGDVVVDPFMGSGTTLRAAKDCGMSAIGIELEERYCEIAAKRLMQGVLCFEEAFDVD